MRQILLLILLFVVGQWFVRALRRAQPQSRPGAQPGPNPQGGQGAWRASSGTGSAAGADAGAAAGNAQGALPEPMVRCAECGVHAPKSESVAMGSQSFCSHEHARAYAARHTGQGQNRAAR
ncbi:PP0621 family protein [Paraburkholderia ferrariae]|uniref:PP0621 family protein n=1 Tax=Paraburkholderia ferrariae TaxID=386056 RepID=UPI000482DA25|nr:PP0621 family protein [Paraburkholderia ferrariae]